MSATEIGITVHAVHMRVTYFERDDGDLVPLTDVAAAFRQLESLLKYALAVQEPHGSSGTIEPGYRPPHGQPDVSEQASFAARAHVLAALAGRLTGHKREEVAVEALDAAHAIGDESLRAEVLEHLTEPLSRVGRSQSVLDAAGRIGGERLRARLLVDLAERLSGSGRSGVVREVLAITPQIDEESIRADVLGALAEHVTEDEAAEALAVARQIYSTPARIRLWVTLARRLSAFPRDEVVAEALHAAREITDDSARAEVLRALVERLSEEHLGEVLAAASEITREPMRAEVLVALAERLSEEHLDEVLAAAREIASALAAVGAPLPDEKRTSEVWSDVSVVSVNMHSPLSAVLEIPAELWLALGPGLLMLLDRIATTRARIARKQKEELRKQREEDLKIAKLDRDVELVQRGRADALAQLWLEVGPPTGPSEVVVFDPDDPDDELEPTSSV